jgi:arylsulfatase A-like enzyme
MRRRTSILVVLAVVLIPTFTWLLWPAADPRFVIVDDEATLSEKDRFLRETPVTTEGERPNIVLILADDLGKHDLTLYGQAPVDTPNINRIAKEGAMMTEGYITSPICAPSRAGLLTGRYQQRYGFELITHERYPRNRLEWFFAKHLARGHGWEPLDELLVPESAEIVRQGLPPSELTVAELLKKRGYATGIFGKWHLGFNEQAIPTHRGFDYAYGFYEAFSLYQDPEAPDVVNAKIDLFADKYHWYTGRHGNCAIRRNGVEIDEKVYLTESIAKETVEWISAHAHEPFFAYVPFSAPHAPLQAPKRYVDRFAHVQDPALRVYYAMIASLDDAVGEILDVLEKKGIADNTIVMFLSDNGGVLYNRIADNKPLKGGKLTHFEGGVNVPFALRFPKSVPSGLVMEQPVSALDLFATIIAQSHTPLPQTREYDGVDLVPFLRGENKDAPHEALYWRAEGQRAIRVGSYKLVTDSLTGARALYDLANDKSELHNILSQRPEIVTDLEGKLRAWEKHLIRPSWPHVMNYHFNDGEQTFVFPL